MEIIKVKRNTIEELDVPDNVEDIYLLKNELETIGYGFINYNSANEINVFVKDEYRGEDNGEKIFKALYDDFNGSEIHFDVELSNYPMIKIIEKYNGLNLGTNEGITRYVMKKD